jgi:2'-5' RNA ligase
MPFFNLAYRPVDDAFAKKCIAYAQDRFARTASEYLLNARNALPHITVCQFETTAAKLPQLWRHATAICAEAQIFTFSHFRVRPGTGMHENFLFAQLNVHGKPTLTKQQALVAEMLAKFNITPLTGTHENYGPHLTYARLKPGTNIEDIKSPPKSEMEQPRDFYFTLGRSDVNGVYQKMIYPAMQAA